MTYHRMFEPLPGLDERCWYQKLGRRCIRDHGHDGLHHLAKPARHERTRVT